MQPRGRIPPQVSHLSHPPLPDNEGRSWVLGTGEGPSLNCRSSCYPSCRNCCSCTCTSGRRRDTRDRSPARTSTSGNSRRCTCSSTRPTTRSTGSGCYPWIDETTGTTCVHSRPTGFRGGRDHTCAHVCSHGRTDTGPVGTRGSPRWRGPKPLVVLESVRVLCTGECSWST